MNVVLADQYARDHTDTLLAAAAQARLVRQARAGRRRGHRRSTTQA